MQSENRIFDDIARVAGGAASAFGSLKDQIRSEIRHRVDTVIANMDLVRREEFDAVSAMAAKARMEQEQLEKRLAAVEAKLGIKAKKPAPKKSAPKKSAAKKTAAKKTTKKTAAKKAAPKTKTASGKSAASKAKSAKPAAKASKSKSASAKKGTKRS